MAVAKLIALLVVLSCTWSACALRSVRVRDDALDHWKRPWYYHSLDGPEFKVWDKKEAYEERLYYGGKWASTNVESYLYSAATATGFRRLFSYISGHNVQNQTIPMTVPVRVKVSPGDGPFCKNNFRVSFWIPRWKQDDVPEPRDNAVFIEKDKNQTIFVKTFSGFALDPVVALKASAFVAELHEDDQPIVDDYFYTAGYDPPFRLVGRHNEIWVKKAEEEDHRAVN